MGDNSVPFRPPIIDVLSAPARTALLAYGRTFTCTYCDFKCTRYNAFDQHFETSHLCCFCCKVFINVQDHECHELPQQVGEGQSIDPDNLPFPVNGAFKVEAFMHHGAIVVFQHTYDQDIAHVEQAFELVLTDLQLLLIELVRAYRGIRAQINLNITLEHIDTGKLKNQTFYTPFIRFTFATNDYIASNIITAANFINSSLDLYSQDGSNWRVKKIHFMLIKAAQYKPIRAGAYLKTGRALHKKEIINIRTNGNDCFLLSLLCSLFRHSITLPDFPDLSHEQMNKAQRQRLKYRLESPSSYAEILKHVQTSGELDLQGFFGAVSLDEISEFEARNPSIGVSVFGCSGKDIFPLRMCDKAFPKYVDLLLLKGIHEGKAVQHFTVIPSLGKLLGKDGSHAQEICRHCLTPHSEAAMPRHLEKCREVGSQNITFPRESDFEFKNFHMLEDINFKAFYEFAIPSSGNVVEAYHITLVDPAGTISFNKTYRGENVMTSFVNDITYLVNAAIKIVSDTNVPIVLSPENQLEYDASTCCSFCKEPYTYSNHKVKHHHHYLKGRKIIAACNSCNLKIRAKPIVFIAHDSSAVHHRLILNGLNRRNLNRISTFATSSTNIPVLFLIRKAMLIDTKAFMDADLPTLVERLKGNSTGPGLQEKFPTLHQWCKHPVQIKYALMITKYTKLISIITDLQRLTDCFEERVQYHHVFNEKEVEIVDTLNYAKQIRLHFGVKNNDDLVTYYLRIRTYLLADVTASFTNFCVKKFQLAPLHTFSVASYAYSLGMWTAKYNFEYFSDCSIIQSIRSGIRGGLLFSNRKACQANTERLGCFNGDSSTRKEILYVDFNSVFAACLKEMLAIGNYEWLSDEHAESLDIDNIPENTGTGYCFVVDLDYGDNLNIQNRDRDLPMAPSKRIIQFDQVSQQQQILFNTLSFEVMNPFKGEIPSLDMLPKQNYFVYYKNLKYYKQRGLRVTKVHRVLSFSEAKNFEDFVNKCIDARNQAKIAEDEIGNKFTKLLYASFVGKTLSSNQNHVDIQPVATRTRALQLTSSHRFQDFTVVSKSNDISFFHLSQASVTYNFPLLIGFQVLELCKLQVYKAWERIQATFAGARALYGNTDSLVCEIPDPDKLFLNKLRTLSDLFDFSNIDRFEYPQLFSNVHKDEPGFLKIVDFGITEFLSYKCGSFSYQTVCSFCKTKFNADCVVCQEAKKGVQKICGLPLSARKNLNHKKYRELLTTENLNKLNIGNNRRLNSLNVRRFELPGGDSLPHGHYMTQDFLTQESVKLVYGVYNCFRCC